MYTRLTLFFCLIFIPISIYGQVTTSGNSSTTTSSTTATVSSTTDTSPNSITQTEGESNFGNEGASEEEEVSSSKTSENILTPLFNYNFSGKNNGLSNLTPIIDYGWTKTLNKKGIVDIDLSVNPYVGSQINTKDPANYIPALMLPGNAGIRMNLLFNIKLNDFTIGVAPLNFAFKVISSFADSTKTVAQHNIRHGLVIRYLDALVIGAQFVESWHNSTSESEKNFTKVFSKDKTNFNYLVVSAQILLSNKFAKTPTYLFGEFRTLLNNKDYESFTNNRILSFGVRKDISLDQALPGAPSRGRFRSTLPRSRRGFPGTL